MGRLVPMSKFFLLASDGIHYSDGILHAGHKEGGVDPSVALNLSGKEIKKLVVSAILNRQTSATARREEAVGDVLGLALPNPPTPVGNYVPAVKEGNIVYVSGQTARITLLLLQKAWRLNEYKSIGCDRKGTCYFAWQKNYKNVA